MILTKRLIFYLVGLWIGALLSPMFVFTYLNWGNKSIECWKEVRKPFIPGYSLLYRPLSKEGDAKRAQCMGLTIEADLLVRRWDISAPYPFVD